MEPLFQYLLEASLCMLMFYGLYRIVLSQLTHFGWNRYYLLISLLLSISIPAISLGKLNFAPVIIGTFSYDLPEMLIQGEGKAASGYNFWHIMLKFYWIGVLFNLGLFLISLFQIFKMASKAQKRNIGEIVLYQNPNFKPASFFRYIFLPDWDLEKAENKMVFEHEYFHYSRYHSFDIIFWQILKAFFWFHPVAWLYGNSIKEVHEFEADMAVTSQYPKKQYAGLLLQLIKPSPKFQLINSFNQFQTKKRILMMSKNPSPVMAKSRFLLALPMIALMLFFFSCEKDSSNELMEPTAEEVNQLPGESDLMSSDRVLPADEIFDVVETSPEFPGGMEAWMKFLQENLKYPAHAKASGIEGTVYVVFVIDENGKISNEEILRGIGEGCDEEALRVVSKSPDWIPGKQRGEPVKVRMRLPIRYKIQ